jgi:signal transduction histidine kinase
VVKLQQLPVLSQIIQTEQSSPQAKADNLRGWREWYGAIATLPSLLGTQGLILSSPAPVMKTAQPNQNFTSVVFIPELSLQGGNSSRLLTLAPATGEYSIADPSSPMREVPLSAHDPLQNEQFCLVFTAKFSLLLVLTLNEQGQSCFDFSFDPEVTEKAWLTLRSRLQTNAPEQLSAIQQQREQFPLCSPDYRLVSDFTRELLNHLPANRETHEEIPATATTASTTTSSSTDVELLQALTHEVRTPLTTIRMLTRLLLKRKDLGNDVLKRLRAIDQECTEQINRMELIFQATELEGKNESKQEVNVSPIPLQELFAQSIPYWKKQAKRRNVELDVIVPEQLPTVITNPELLTQVLTGLMENFTSRLPTGGKIKVQVKSAGHQIKLQLLSQSSSANTVNPVSSYRNRGKSIGQLLTLQPETGNLSLNLSVTKNLFEAIGGKLTVRQRPEVGEELTVFLPANLIR